MNHALRDISSASRTKSILQLPSGILSPKQVDLGMRATAWLDAVRELALLLQATGKLSSVDDFVESVQSREAASSTYCGSHIAIPHGISETVLAPAVAIGRCSGFAWHETEEWTKLVFLVAIPREESPGEYDRLHLHILSSIAALAIDDRCISQWLAASSSEEVVDSIVRALAID